MKMLQEESADAGKDENCIASARVRLQDMAFRAARLDVT